MTRRHPTLGFLAVGCFLLSVGCGDESTGSNDNANTNTNEPVCGNGQEEPTEECDDSEGNSDTVPNACRTDCRDPWCGDGVCDTATEASLCPDCGGAVDVSAGGGHTCALDSHGRVLCWGGNAAGQLGNDSTTGSATPLQVSDLTDAVAVSAGVGYTCAIASDGTAWCWGLNYASQLGDGQSHQICTLNEVDYDCSLTPVQVPGLTDVVSISASFLHTCAVLFNGTAWCWGLNYAGQLGDGQSHQTCTVNDNDCDCSPIPVQVSGLTDAVSISAGSSHTCTVVSDGTTWCWGLNTSGQLGDGQSHQTCTVNDNDYDCSLTPVQVSGLADVVSISAGGGHTCTVVSDSTAWCWGGNNAGQLGIDSYSNSATPVQLGGLTEVVSISAGDHHTCVVLSDSTAWCWGLNTTGQLGNDSNTVSTTPVQVADLINMAAISAGPRHTCTVASDGTAWCWGLNQYFQLGDGQTHQLCTAGSISDDCSLTPVQVITSP